MTLVAPPPSATPAALLLRGVSWRTYCTLRDETDAAGQKLYITYDNGVMEIMPPLPVHERIKTIIHGLIEVVCEERAVDVEPLGSTTYRREAIAKGLEPDQCYFIARAAQAREQKFDAAVTGPVPDLAVEVDITNRSVAREPIYAALGVPELWRYSAEGLRFLVLSEAGRYEAVERSLSFSFLSSADLEAFLDRADTLTYMELLRQFRDWVKSKAKER